MHCGHRLRRNISIHALREEGDGDQAALLEVLGHISIHALREEGDSFNSFCLRCHSLFLSTPSARRATCWYRPSLQCRDISIHALREEGDISVTDYENIRATFLSTPSARRATTLLAIRS